MWGSPGGSGERGIPEAEQDRGAPDVTPRSPVVRRARGALIGFLALALVGSMFVAAPFTPGGGPFGFGFGLGDITDVLRGVVGGRDGGPPAPEPIAELALPRNEKAPTGKKLGKPKRVKELKGRRTAYTRHYLLSDGRTQAEISTVPRHYPDRDGDYRPIDTGVGPSDRDGYRYQNTTNNHRSFFGDDTSRLATVEFDGTALTFGVAGEPQDAYPAAVRDTVTYRDAVNGADLVYRVTARGVKEDIVLRRAPADPTYTFRVRGGRDIVAAQRRDGSIAFAHREAPGLPIYVIPKPFMYDSRNDRQSPYGKVWSGKVRQTLQRSGEDYLITVRADRAWLHDKARKYPVTIDPTVKIQPLSSDSQDAMIISDDPAVNFNGNWRLSVGTTDTAKARSVLKFPVSEIPTGTQLDSALLQVYFDQNHTADKSVPMEARRITEAWDASTVTWNSINPDFAEGGANAETVDNSDTGKVSMIGEWPVSTNSLIQYAIKDNYQYNLNAVTGDKFTWVPNITETGSYQVQAHYVAATDRTTVPYTVHHAGGQTTVNVNQASGSQGVWANLGTYSFNAGTSHKVVLGDVADSSKAVIADAVRFVKQGTVFKPAGQSSVWHSYDIRNIAQSWVNGTNPNYGIMLKAADENNLGEGGPRYEASELAYNGEYQNYPKLLLTYGRPGVAVNAPDTIHATGAELSWPAYQDPNPGDPNDDIVEYQVHRSVHANFTPRAATLLAPVDPSRTTFTDTTATPTAVNDPDPFGQVYSYMIAVKTRDGEVIAGPPQQARLPRAGRIMRILQGSAPDTTLTSGQATTNQDVLAGNPWLMVGNNSSTYGTARSVVKFTDLASKVPTNAQVIDAYMSLWSVTTIGSGNSYTAHALTRDFTETTATWTKANSTTNWTTPGGDFNSTVLDTVSPITNDPARREFTVTNQVQTWVTTPTTNKGLLVKLGNEAGAAERTLFLSSEAPEPQLRPQLVVTYTEPTPAQTYHAPYTPSRMIPGDLYTVKVTLNNPTTSTWTATDWELSYRWTLPDGTDVTNAGNQLATALPADVPPREAVDINAQLRTPIQSDEGNKRTEYVLKWDLRNKITGQWLSVSHGIGSLDQPVAVEDPTSNQLGLEKFYQYTASPTGSGSSVMANLYAGNTVFEYNPIANPSRGLATFVRMTYNSQDTSASSMGHGWSLATSTLTRLGSPLHFHPPGQDWPTEVTYMDGDGTSHTFELNTNGSPDPANWRYEHPAGVYLYLQRNQAAGDEARSWMMTRPDRTQVFFDDEGFPSATRDRNGNELLFTYEERRSNNKPTKFLQYLTDPSGRVTLRLNWYEKGQSYWYIDSTGTKVQGSNLTNPKIIDQVESITDISGRRIELTYTTEGLMAELIDGAGNSLAKTFRFTYDMTQGNRNVKLVAVTDPRGNTTDLAYYEAPIDPRDKWKLRTITDRRDGVTNYAYVDPDGAGGSFIEATVTDAESHATMYLMDGYGRPTEITDAKNHVNTLGWDAENNVTRLEENNGAVTTWSFDPKTGYPLTRRDAEANADGTPATVMTYQTGLDGHIADLITKTSPEGRAWTFGYDTVGNLTSVTDPKGTPTPDPDDYKTTYGYDSLGQLQTATDANGNVTTYGEYQPVGYPQLMTDALGRNTRTYYDDRGNVTSVTDALLKTSTYQYDVFGRPGESRVPIDQAASEYVVTPAPVYDRNDNVTTETAPNGAVSTVDYDAADRPTRMALPKDTPTGQDRVITTTYDEVGNVLTETEPKGNLTPSDPNDFVTRYVYDEAYQLVETTDANGGRYTSTYDDVGNVTKVVDARKNATTDPNDYTLINVYDLNHQVTQEKDALGHTVTYTFDRDGQVVSTTDQESVTTEMVRDERGLVTEVKVPHKVEAGATTYRITRYEYDEVGNPTRTITPRGVETATDPDDFATKTVYDALNRVKEEWSAYDPDDSRYNQPDKTIYTYDEVGRMSKVSAPPSEGQTVRNDTVYTHTDNGWVKTSTDPWDIVSSYTYDVLGQQTQATVTSAGGSQSRTVGWTYFPDGKLKTRTDSGVPAGKHVVLVDNSDSQHVATTGTWGTSSAGTGFQGYDYRTHAAGSTDTFTWRLTVPADGTYQVWVKYATATATNAPYTVRHADGTSTVTVDQTQNGGQWASLGSHRFTEGISHSIDLGTSATGSVVADAVKLVRDTTGDPPDNESKTFTYEYDVNGNQTEVTDSSSGAEIDTWSLTYDGLNRVDDVEEYLNSVLKHTTSFTYDENSNPLTRTHDSRTATFTYGARDAVASVTHTEPGVSAKTTTFTYTPKGLVDVETAANGNTVDYDYFLDGLPKFQVEKKPDLTVVNEHTLTYTSNSHIATDRARVRSADDGTLLDRTYTYEYDPRDRLTKVTRSAVGGGGQKVQDYVLDPNGNTVSQTIDGTTTNYVYDRNRMLSATAVGGATSTYNYDPYGRLDTVVSGGQVTEKYTYDGFDRTVKHRAGTGANAKTTEYVYDPFDRTLSRMEKVGTPDEKTTEMAYLGVDDSVASETVDGTLARTYQYGGQAERLSMVKHNSDGTKAFSVYGYDTRGNVEILTNESGGSRTTYGYTAYGSPDNDLATGVDKPDPLNPDKEPYNTFRFGAKQLDPATGNYDMGARDYDPGLNRFTSRDMYNGALADIGLSTDPFTMNRYAFAGGNPLSRIEMDGHWGWSDIGHAALDVVGLIPVVGEVADLANAAWYAAEGNYADAALSAAGAIPFVGWGAAAAKGAKYAYKGIDAARSGSKGVDEAADVAGATRKADAPSAKDPDAPKGGGSGSGSGPKGGGGGSGPPKQPAQPPKQPDPAPPAAKAPDCKANSFTPETRVVMADGTTKAIEDVQVGDLVLATDPKTGEAGGRMVLALIIGQGDKDLVEVTVDTDGDSGDDTGTVVATDGHPFWVENLGAWVDAKDLQPGDMLRTSAGTWVQVTATRQFQRHQRAHNLTIADIHTYHVTTGDTQILVHNTGPDCGTAFGREADGVEEFHGSEYSLDEMVEFINGHTDDGNPIMGRPSSSEVEAALRNAKPEPMAGTGTRSKFELNGVRAIINFDAPWRSTAYYPGRRR